MNVECCIKGASIKKYSTHSHKSWEIIAMQNGNNEMIINGQLHKIDECCVIILPPNTQHSAESTENFCDIYVRAKEFDFNGVAIVHDSDKSISTLMNMMNKVLLEKEKNYNMIANALLETICQYVKKYRTVESKYACAAELKNIIFENFSALDFSIKKSMEKVGFQQDYLRRRFKEEYEKTPQEYLTFLRINLSKNLLVQDSFIGIDDVARRCGFKDNYYFSTCFKKHTGYSPSEYRKQHKKV